MTTNRHIAALVAVSVCYSMSGCGGGVVVENDAGSIDGGVVLDDDGGTDAPSPQPDAAVLDTDGDGVPDAVDCDPMSADVGSAGARDCTNACGTGAELCHDGVWDPCNAPVDCFCTMDAALRMGPCGMCGTQLQRCMGGTWTAAGACGSEGICMPGATRIQTNDHCQQTQFACQLDCTWDTGTVIVPGGECAPPYRDCAPPDHHFRCASDCHWVDDPTCT